MAGFQYEPYRSDLTGTIADLMTRGDRARADALRQGGAASARAAEIGGQASADLGRNLAQIASGTIDQVLKYKQDEPRRKMEALQLSEAQRAATARDAFTKIIKETPQLDEDGVSLYDIPTVAKQLAAAGQDPSAAVQHLSGLNDAFRAEKAAKLALVKTGAEKIIAGGNDPALAGLFLDQLERNRSYPKEQIDQFRAFIAADPANVAKVTAMLVGPQKLENAAPGSMARNPLTGQVVPGSAVPEDPNKGAYTINGQRFSADGKPIGALVAPQTPTPAFQSKDVLVNGKPAVANFDPHTGKYFDAQGTELTDVKPIPPKSSIVNIGGTGALDKDGVEFAATEYRVTGKMPALGMGNGQARAAIINAAAKQSRVLGQTPAAAIQKQSAFKSDGKALDRMTVMKAAAESFETKALAQADKVVELSNKVGRSKWPIVNAALLAGKTEIAGDTDASLLLNATLTFSSEYAKLIEGSTGSAQGSSDAARRTADRLLNPKMNKGTVEGAVGLMKWEMSQTIQGYDATIAHITDRMGGRPQAPEPPPAPTSPPAQAGAVKMQAPDGSIAMVDPAHVAEAQKKGAKVIK